MHLKQTRAWSHKLIYIIYAIFKFTDTIKHLKKQHNLSIKGNEYGC